MSVALDTSAILALILGEPGSERVAAVLDEAVVSTVILAEVYSYAARNGHPLDAYDAFFDLPGVAIMALGSAEARYAGQLAGITQPAGVSLGDRCCLALAKGLEAKVLTADRPWLSFAEPLGLDIEAIR